MDEIGLKMKELIQKEGLEILCDEKKLNGLLADMFPKEGKMRSAIREALKIGAGNMFYELAKSTGNDASEKLAAIRKKLVDEAWLSDAAAENVCRIFLTAVGKSADIVGNTDAFGQKDAQKQSAGQPQPEPTYNQQQSGSTDAFNSPAANETNGGKPGNNEKESRMTPKMYIMGIIGALLGSCVGVACALLLGYMGVGYIAAAAGAVTGFCAVLGFKLLGKRLTKAGIVITCVVVLGMAFLGWLGYAVLWEDAVVYDSVRNVMEIKKNNTPDYSGDNYRDDFYKEYMSLLRSNCTVFSIIYVPLTAAGTTLGIILVSKKQKAGPALPYSVSK